MKTLEYEGRKVIALEHEDFITWHIPIKGSIDVLLVPKEHMKGFRDTELFQCLWECLTDNTRIVYC